MNKNISTILLSTFFLISCGDNNTTPVNQSIDINKTKIDTKSNTEILEEQNITKVNTIINTQESNTTTDIDTGVNKDTTTKQEISDTKSTDSSEVVETDNHISQDEAVKLSPSNYSIPFISSSDKIKYLDAINEARAEARDCGKDVGFVAGADPLIWNDDLFNASYEHNYDMVNSVIFGHNGSGSIFDITGTKLSKESNTEDRIRNSSYLDADKMVGVIGAGIGENLAGGYETIEEAIQGWIDSPLHCKNLMDSSFKEMGISKVKNPNFVKKDGKTIEYYWTHVFGYKNK